MWMTLFNVLVAALVLARLLRRRPALGVLAALAATAFVTVESAVPEWTQQVTDLAVRVKRAETRAPHSTLYTPREVLAVRWFNANLAAVGWLLGMREVAWETWKLDAIATPENAAKTRAKSWSERADLCRGAKNNPELPVVVRASDFPMDSADTREAVHYLIQRTREGQERWVELDWESLNPIHVTLALNVPDSRLWGHRAGDFIELRWTGTIAYPPDIIATFEVPRLFGEPTRMVLNEAVFCGMQMDGAWMPYRLEYHWQISITDPRVQPPFEGRKRWLENLLGS